jgi:aspartate/methionine/tyrosine aminotransferase
VNWQIKIIPKPETAFLIEKSEELMRVARRMDDIPFSGIRKIFEEVSRRETNGEQIIHLEIGRPDFDTPERIKAKAHWALDQGRVHYSSNYGIPELREAIVRKLGRDNGLEFKPDNEVIVTIGANEAVFITMMALLNPGDEVLIPEPCWPHYFYCAHLAGAKPVPVPLRPENNFQPDPDDFYRKATPQTRMMVVNSPHNPTGAVFSRDAMEGLAQLARGKNLFVLSDEIYEKMIYESAVHHSIGALPGMRDRTVTVNGLSKIYAMTGWRLGYMAAPSELIDAMIRVHQYTTVCAATFAQWGAVEALDGPQSDAHEMVQEFDRRRRLICENLTAMKGVDLVVPQGAFYVFPHVGDLMKDTNELSWYLLDEARVALVPGEVFGSIGHEFIRISYANSYQNLERGMKRIADALAKLQKAH